MTPRSHLLPGLLVLVGVWGCGAEGDSRPLASLRDTLGEDSTVHLSADSLLVEGLDGPTAIPVDSLAAYLNDRGGSPEGAGVLERDLEPPAWTVLEIHVDQAGAPEGSRLVQRVEARTVEDRPGGAFDRLTVTLDTTVAYFEAEYVPGPIRECGSGRVLDLPGEAFLELDLESARGHRLEGGEVAEVTVEPRRRTPGLSRVLEVARRCDFEGMVSLVLAVDRPTAFRAFAEDAGRRIFLDVRH